MKTESIVTRWSRRWWLWAFVLLLVVGWIMLGLWKPRFPKHLYQQKSKSLSCAHRGGSALAPENTMHAFKAATQCKSQVVEFDVMLSSDNHVVVFHDHHLQKRLYAEGTVKKMTLAQLRQVDVSSYWKEQHPGKPLPPVFRASRIPTLDEVFQYYQKHPDMILNIELKTNKAKGDGLEELVAKAIRRFGLAKRSIVSSFNPFALWRFRMLMPEVPRGLIYAQDTAIYLRRLWLIDLAQPDALHPDFHMVDKAYMAWAKQRGFAVNVWTVNKEEDMRRMIKLGVDMIITDHPDRLNRLLAQSKL